MLLDGYARDTDALARRGSIRQPVLSRSDIESSFDNATTYSKGAAVLRMFEHWVGEEPMRKALRAYLASKAWGNATLRRSGRGARHDRARRRGARSAPSSISRACPSSRCRATVRPAGARLQAPSRALPAARGPGPVQAQTWRIPVCLRWPERATTRRTLRLCCRPPSRRSTSTPARPGCSRTKPPPATTGSPTTTTRGAAWPPRPRRDPTRRSRLSSGSPSSTISRHSPAAAACRSALALEALPWALKDPDPLVVSEALDLLQLLQPDRLSPDLRPHYARLVQALLGARATALGWEPAGDAPDARQLRGRLVPHAAIYGEDATLAAEARRRALAWLSDRQAADPDLDVEPAPRGGEQRLTAASSTACWPRPVAARIGRSRRSCSGRSGTSVTPRSSRRRSRCCSSDDFDTRESVAILWGLFGRRATQDAAWAFVREQFDTAGGEGPQRRDVLARRRHRVAFLRRGQAP